MMYRALSTLFGALLLVAIATTGPAQQPTADTSSPASTSGPSLTIDNATVDGHQVRLHVSLQGADLAQASDTGMAMSGQMSGTDMSGMSMPMDHGAMSSSSGSTGGHLHVYVDGSMLVMVTQPDITLTDVPSGGHEVRVELSDNLHQPYDPPVQATTSVVVP